MSSTDVIDNLTPEEPLLPRKTWNNQIKHLKILFRVKKSLDNIEKEYYERRSLDQD
jgi:hypothetical protein